MYRVLITGAGSGGGENLIRSLRAAFGSDIYIAGANMDQYTLYQTKADVAYYLPSISEPDYIDMMNRIVARERIDLVIPNSDNEVWRVSRDRHLIGAKTFLPSHGAVEVCQDKLQTYTMLMGLGVVANTWSVVSMTQLHELFNTMNPYNAPVFYWVRLRKGSGSKAATKVRNAQQAAAWIQYWCDMRGVELTDFLVSDYLPGSDYAYQSLWLNGRMIMGKCAQRLDYLFGSTRASGQSSSPRTASLVNNDSAYLTVKRAIPTIDPFATGNFCVDLKCNEMGMPMITEINCGRFFMITNIFNLTGQWNMAEWYVRIAMGEEPPKEMIREFPGDAFLIREMDTEPSIATSNDIMAKVRYA